MRAILYRLFQQLLASGRSRLIDLGIIKCFSMQFVCIQIRPQRRRSSGARHSFGKDASEFALDGLPLRGLVNKFSIACKTLTWHMRWHMTASHVNFSWNIFSNTAHFPNPRWTPSANNLCLKIFSMGTMNYEANNVCKLTTQDINPSQISIEEAPFSCVSYWSATSGRAGVN